MLFDDLALSLDGVYAAPEHERPQKLAELLRPLDAEELRVAIYMAQGRFGSCYDHRMRGDHETSLHLAEKLAFWRDENLQAHGEASSATVIEVYAAIHKDWEHIERWLTRQEPPPSQLAALLPHIGRGQLSILALMLAGPLFDDQQLCKAILRLTPHSTTDALSALWNPYRYTLPDLGRLAVLTREQGSGALLTIEPMPGIPVPLESLRIWYSLEQAWADLGQVPCRASPKFDGLYVQVHKLGDEVCVFGRKILDRNSWVFDDALFDMSTILPELAPAVQDCINAQTAILEGELVGFAADGETVVPWDRIMQAAERRVYLYDLLLLDDQDLRATRYIDRRVSLEATFRPSAAQPQLALAPEVTIRSLAELTTFFDFVVQHHYCEGLVLKSQVARYLSGRESRGRGKVKHYVSLDAVVLGYRHRRGMPTSLLLGLWDRDPLIPEARLVPIGMVESAKASRTTWEELTPQLQRLTRRGRPPQVALGQSPDKWIEPSIVVEVGCDGQLVADPRVEPLGLVLRDKTFLRMRPDKDVFSADTVVDFLQLRLAPGEAPVLPLDSISECPGRLDPPLPAAAPYRDRSPMSTARTLEVANQDVILRPGTLEVFIGCMFSGKTTRLIDIVQQLHGRQYRTQVIRPTVDTRSPYAALRTHNGQELPAHQVMNAAELLRDVDHNTQIVVIDEVQFFDETIVDAVLTLVNQGRHLIVAGLDLDFRAMPFGPMPTILACASVVHKLAARCTVCGADAHFSQRLVDGRPASFYERVVLLGGSELYEPRCRRHHEVPSRPLALVRKHQDSLDWQLHALANQLRAIAQNGLEFSEITYDRERYGAIMDVVAEIGALLGQDIGQLQALDSVRVPMVPVHPPRYETPRVAVAVATFNTNDDILLIKRSDNQTWALPGGWADVGLTPIENAVQEVFQETGLHVHCNALVGVYDARLHQVGTALNSTYTLVFQAHIIEGSLSLHREEVLSAGFFTASNLPELQPGAARQVTDAFHFHIENLPTRFD